MVSIRDGKRACNLQKKKNFQVAAENFSWLKLLRARFDKPSWLLLLASSTEPGCHMFPAPWFTHFLQKDCTQCIWLPGQTLKPIVSPDYCSLYIKHF